MIKKDIVRVAARDTGYSAGVVSDVVDAVLVNITFALARGEKVRFAGFGVFEPRSRAARVGQNPRTGERICIPAKVTPVFMPSARLKRMVAE